MGLKRIVLRDFVIVDELDLDLESGFTVLTGETGAGKSILIDALQLVTGARADVGVIREGAQRTDVSAEFDSPDALSPFLEDAGFESSESLLLRRTVDLTGKSRAWVNGSTATAQQLRHLGEYLLDIHGQHAWQSLTRPDAVRGLLDGYAQISTQKLSTSWQQWRHAQNTLAQALQAQDSLQQEQERLAWQISELEKLSPQEAEWEALNANHSRLAHAQTLMDTAQAAVNFIEDEEGNALQGLNAALQQLQHQVHLDADLQSPIDALVSSIAQIEDAAHSLRSYLRRTELDPQGLAELDARLALWISLARRYKRSPEELPALLSSWRDALAALAAATDIEGLKSQENQTHKAYLEQAKLISKARAKAAPLLADAITQAMQGLGMQGGQFQVALEPLGQAQQSGLEDIVFLVAGHAGSTPRPVGKVASGGELSRMALAIAVTTSQLGTAQTLIFDEVDAGVGGTVAHTVGQLMRKLGLDRQVLAVTHLPQVAACADNHWVVSKRLQSGMTVSTVSAVTETLRTSEIARMLGGDASSKTTLAHAQEMLARSAA